VTDQALRSRSADTGQAGVEGNSRLTSVTGLLLILLLAVEGATILSIESLISVHVFVGVLLLGPVLLKVASAGYRFLRYYGGSEAYRVKGPPHPVLRVLGPLVIVSTLALLGTGLALLAVPRERADLLVSAHQASFIVWFAVMVLHVLGHLHGAVVESMRELRGLRADPASRHRLVRLALIGLALVAGVALATALLPAAAGWTGGFEH
jgi:hypothetical protein